MDPRAHEHIDSVRFTLISLIVAFVLTLVFRGFVVEAFIIPTGSMAPTLLGEHWRLRSPVSGHAWAVKSGVAPRAPGEGLDVSDPITRAPLTLTQADKSAGDRILVLKGAYAFRDPRRWDTVVFKYPERPRENFIKRLVGLPNEEIWLVDGDVFVRNGKTGSSEPGAEATGHPTNADWHIARKPDRIQRALWQPVWNSESAWAEGLVRSGEPNADESAPGSIPPPFVGEGWWWINEGRSLRHDGAAPATLTWDSAHWPITDWTPYNDPDAPTYRDERRYFSVSDIRVRFAIEPHAPIKGLTIIVRARGHESIADVRNFDPHAGSSASSAGIGVTGPNPLTDAMHHVYTPMMPDRPLLPADVITSLEFWLFDQRLELWLNGERVAWVDCAWSPRERLAHATGKSPVEIAALLGENPNAEPTRGNPLADPTLYSPPQITLEFSGGPITLHRLGVDRDIYYRPAVTELDPRIPARATHPSNLARLSPDEFFVLGDNSGASKDGRLWDSVDPWVAHSIDPEPGVVPRSLLLGQAFFVYFPAAHQVTIANQPRPFVPDFGRMRFIR